MRLQCMITGRQGQAAHLYDRLVRSCQQPGANKYILKRRKQTTIFPAEIFAESKRVTLEGAELQVPEMCIRDRCKYTYNINATVGTVT